MSTWGNTVWGGGAPGSSPFAGSVPVKPLFYAALRLAHVTKYADANQAAPSPDQLGDCLQQAQLMLDGAAIKRWMIWAERLTTYVLGTLKQYTLGPAGSLVSTTGSSIRPVHIERANLILVSTGTPVHLHIHRGSYEEFAALALQDIPGALPKFLYCDYAFPLANVYVVPQDPGGDSLEIYDWQSMPSLQTVNDQIALPPGYAKWLVDGLAVRLASIFEERGAWVTQDTKDEAAKGERAIQRLNTKSPRISSDAPGGDRRRGDFNQYTGTPT